MPKIDEIQRSALERLFVQPTTVQPLEPLPLLAKIKEVGLDCTMLALGKHGENLMNFINQADNDHPDFVALLQTIFTDKENDEYIIELLDLSSYAIKNNLTKALTLLSNKLVARDRWAKWFLKTVGDLAKSKSHTRLLPDRAGRDAIRLHKKMQSVNLDFSIKKGTENWKAQPVDFADFVRFNKPYEEQISLAEKKAQRYVDLGCDGLAKQIYESIDDFRESIDSYHGFNRVTLANASIIIAKNMGYKLLTKYDNEDRETSHIIIPPACFGKEDFFVYAGPSLYQPVSVGERTYDYEPRAYPLHAMAIPSGMAKVIDYLEAFPDVGGKSIFDNYIILVPGPALSPNPYGEYEVAEVKTESREEAVKFLDQMLIQNNHITPVLLGERDGKCYFICYWENYEGNIN